MTPSDRLGQRYDMQYRTVPYYYVLYSLALHPRAMKINGPLVTIIIDHDHYLHHLSSLMTAFDPCCTKIEGI